MNNLFKTKKSRFFWGLSLLATAAIVSCTNDEELTTSLESKNESFATPEDGKIYSLKNRDSGRYMDVLEKSNSTGANIQQYGSSVSSTDTHRMWEVISVDDGIVRLKGVDSGKSIEVEDGSNSSGANIQQSAYDSSTHQQWELIPTDDGYYRIKGVDSGKSIAVKDGSSSDGANIEIRSWNGTEKFEWLFNEIGSSSTPSPIEEEEEEEEEEPTEQPDVNPGDADIPSDLMRNCDQWKITFPDGDEEKQLCGFDNNEYYFVNDDKNAIVFRAPMRSDNGSTPNSDYIRSELRERTEDGSSDIYWTTDGTHVVYAKQAITHLPTVKDHLVATQIHGDKSAGIDDSMVLRLEGSHLFLSFNGGKLRDDFTIINDYKLGTIHEVIFEVVDGKHYCYYSEDGKLGDAYRSGNASSYLVKDGSRDYVMDLDYDESYFKIGNYTQSNAEEEGNETDKSNNYGEVYVYDFWVEHDD